MNITPGWTVRYNPKPIPDRSYDYEFIHSDYDFCAIEGDNGLSGTGDSFEDCISQIKEIEKEKGMNDNIEIFPKDKVVQFPVERELF